MKTKQSQCPVNPLGERIIVTDPRDEEAKAETNDHNEKIVGGIVIPTQVDDTSKLVKSDKSPHHVVTALAVGSGCKLVKKGQRIVVTDQGLFRVNTGGVKFCGVVEGNVVAVVS